MSDHFSPQWEKTIICKPTCALENIPGIKQKCFIMNIYIIVRACFNCKVVVIISDSKSKLRAHTYSSV